MISSCYFRKCDVITRGFSGYNTRWCRVILPDILKEFDPQDIAFATIFLGANDSNLPENTVQHVPLPRYKQDLKDMVEMMMVHMHFNLMFIIIVHFTCFFIWVHPVSNTTKNALCGPVLRWFSIIYSTYCLLRIIEINN